METLSHLRLPFTVFISSPSVDFSLLFSSLLGTRLIVRGFGTDWPGRIWFGFCGLCRFHYMLYQWFNLFARWKITLLYVLFVEMLLVWESIRCSQPMEYWKKPTYSTSAHQMFDKNPKRITLAFFSFLHLFIASDISSPCFYSLSIELEVKSHQIWRLVVMYLYMFDILLIRIMLLNLIHLCNLLNIKHQYAFTLNY